MEVLNGRAHDIYRYFGFSEITSLDNSTFENATFIKNLNEPPNDDDNKFRNSFDLIIDGGTSKHTYNPLIAFSNYLNYLKIKGNLFQSLPMNNYIDHGIYQFSPTFFWSIQTQHRGDIDLKALHFRIHGKKVSNYYHDGNTRFFRSHIDGLWDGSTAANLYRFTPKNVIILANWQKKNDVNLDSFIFQSNQDIYRKKMAKRS